MPTLHLIDPTTPRDALEMLGHLIAPDPAGHAVLVLGHSKFLRAAIRAGIPGDLLTHVHSMGWADLSAWRAVSRVVRAIKPAHLHAWGIRGVAAATVARSFRGQRLATVAGPLDAGQLKLLRRAQSRAAWTWIVASQALQECMTHAGLRDVHLVRPAITLPAPLTAGTVAALHQQLGILPTDGPILLLGGEHETAARPRMALWATGILWQLFGHTRIIVRSEDEWSPAGPAAARLFAGRLPPGENDMPLAAFAPPEWSWQTLVQLADILVITPDALISTGSILHAQAAGVPVIATDIPCTREIIEHEQTGLLASAGDPRSITARLEDWLARPQIHDTILRNAHEQILTHFAPQNMLEQFNAININGTHAISA